MDCTQQNNTNGEQNRVGEGNDSNNGAEDNDQNVTNDEPIGVAEGNNKAIINDESVGVEFEANNVEVNSGATTIIMLPALAGAIVLEFRNDGIVKSKDISGADVRIVI